MRLKTGSKTGSKKEHRKTPQQFYTETLRRTGHGFGDSSKRDPMTGQLKPSFFT